MHAVTSALSVLPVVVASVLLAGDPSTVSSTSLDLGDVLSINAIVQLTNDACTLLVPSSSGVTFRSDANGDIRSFPCTTGGMCKCHRFQSCVAQEEEGCLRVQACATDNGRPHNECYAMKPCPSHSADLTTLLQLHMTCDGPALTQRTQQELNVLGQQWKTALLDACAIDTLRCRYTGGEAGSFRALAPSVAAVATLGAEEDLHRVQTCVETNGPVLIGDCTVWQVTASGIWASSMATMAMASTSTASTSTSTSPLTSTDSTWLPSTPSELECRPPPLPLPDRVHACATAEVIDVVEDFVADEHLASLCVRMRHTYAGDLLMSVVCPSGQRVLLTYQAGGDAGVDGTYCWTPTGTAHFPSPLPMQPDEPLSALDGCSTRGTWSLDIWDLFPGDDGHLHDFTVTLI
ncbi:hypothetical protein PTSG_05455 [Salpingoeca rosetta]|uniref:P/Homo B domain-containing protein n=1 Tax=Salpingoeca rosetta (strain ATCC 50818 / BSB-021) TaxID=946362 RepID=F2UB95_SALR5|nr:uncharacterized protein PTSG_05455 [Salpingoeca rosetta]EGD73761.1 hypothetical protein PTSG_05455 [Salpingoeca rosetta]|eukprot:XP_004993324.1 hypothetical protein PTSG_05455 [Salpingoeca rosetta]